MKTVYPPKIEVEEFKNLVKSHYTTASDNFLTRYKAISNKRSVEGIVDVPMAFYVLLTIMKFQLYKAS